MSELIPYLIGAVAVIVASRFGLNIPFMAKEEPKSTAQDKTDPEIGAFLEWLLKVKSGSIKMDDYDKEALKLVKSALNEVEAK